MTIDAATPNRNYPLPSGGNNLSHDVARLIAALQAVDVDVAAVLSALVLKAPLLNAALSGAPTAPTPAGNDNSTRIATTQWVKANFADFVGAAPAALDTLAELATALGNDANFAATMTAALAAKAPLASPALTGAPTAPTAADATNTTQLATTAFAQRCIALLKAAANTWAALQTFSAGLVSNPPNGQAIGVNGGPAVGTAGLTINSINTGATFISFNRNGGYAANFGIDTDNKWKVGGWSMGAAAYELVHMGNYTALLDPRYALKTSVGTMAARSLTISTSAPAGGVDGDVHMQV
ncbi:hypothetical protein LB565_19235 [Mesorhizobium sp. CA14]|uniref:hypothetical protein n=1 Tax=Mesorhizobium sp. CA14 TaxID=2876642 RepID=UPI001CCA7E66|nr:hypothetical protein [Mesorhizobium sp. CA14]MBZ9850121.1 hypothetical protein [Mesorhizobium sp. CA14]